MIQKAFKKFFFNYCPSFLLHATIRNFINIDYDYDPKLVVKLAETKKELEGAFQVLYRNYLEMGYCEKSESQLRLTLHHALPTTSVIIAKYDGKVVGTLTLVRTNNLKLPCEKEWNIDFLKVADRRVAEITSLAIDKEFRRVKKGNIFLPVLKFMYQFSTERFGTEILAIVVHPKERAFYQGIFFFKPINDVVVQDYYGAPAIGLYLDLIKTKPTYKKVYENKKTSKNLYHFFVQFTSSNIVMPVRHSFSVDYPVLDKKLFNYFFFEKSSIGRQVTVEDMEKILTHYPSRQQDRIANRFTVDIPGVLINTNSDKMANVMIKNISATGLRIVTGQENNGFFDPTHSYRIQFAYSDSIFEMEINYQWSKESKQAGFTVQSNQINWHRFLKSVHSKYASSEDIKSVFTAATKIVS